MPKHPSTLLLLYSYSTVYPVSHHSGPVGKAVDGGMIVDFGFGLALESGEIWKKLTSLIPA